MLKNLEELSDFIYRLKTKSKLLRLSSKILPLLIICSFLYTSALGQGIKFQKQVWDSALTKAEKQDKLVFVDCYTTWCGPCKKMDREVFPQEKVGKFYNKHFVNVKLDMEKGIGKKINEQYDVKGYPTYLFVDAEGNIVHRSMGGMPTGKFLEVGRTAIDPSKNLQGMRKRYKEGDRSPDFIKNYLNVLREAGYGEKYFEILTWYFHASSKDELLTKENFNILFSVGNLGFQTNPDIVEFAIKYRDQYVSLIGEDQYDRRVLNELNSVFTDILINLSEEELNKKVEEISSYAPELAQKAKENAYIEYYSHNNESYKVKKKCIDYIETYLTDSPRETVSYFRQIVIGELNGNNDELYSKAIELVEGILEEDPPNKNLFRDFYACLLYRTGQQEKATEQINMIKKSGEEPTFYNHITSES